MNNFLIGYKEAFSVFHIDELDLQKCINTFYKIKKFISTNDLINEKLDYWMGVLRAVDNQVKKLDCINYKF